MKHDFTRRRHFPGTHRNWFDTLLRVLDFIERLPALIFAALLFGLSLVPALVRTYLFPISFSLSSSFILWLFFLADWALLALLPRFHKSFGPAKPPALMLACLRLPLALFPLPLALAAQTLGSLLVVYSSWIEPHRLHLTRQTLRSNRLKPGRPLRVLHLGDLHAEVELTGRERQLMALARSTAPDVILFSGDFLSLSYRHDPRAWDVARGVLRGLAAPLGVFAVTGSPAVDLSEVVPHVLDGLPIRWLRDEKVTLDHDGQRIDLVGLTCTHKPFLDGPRLLSLLPPPPSGHSSDGGGKEGVPPPPSGHSSDGGGREGVRHFTILLYHTPDLAPEAALAGIDLQLSGHTHGGQVRLPLFGAVITGSLYGKRYESGRRQEGNLTLYVTRGIGMEGKGAPRMRFLCPPEVILWEIYGEAET